MAVRVGPDAPAPAPAPVAGGPGRPARTVWLLARLKLRVLGNGLRGQPWRIGLFVMGCLVGLWFAGMGFLLFALPAVDPGDPDVAVTVLGLGGGLVVLGWFLLPLVFFGVDETLDPARFALLPLPRRVLIAGLTAAGLVGIPAAATLIATSGSVLTVAAIGGPAAAVVQVLGVVAGLLLCVAVSRAVTSGLATALRSRRMRDLAAIVLALLAGSLGPLQLVFMRLADSTDLDELSAAGQVVAWTPLGAPYTVGLDVAQGRPLIAAAKLAGTAAVIAALLWWWSRALEPAMIGTESSGQGRPARGSAGSPVALLFPRWAGWLPRTPYGALVAREVRYWWRDTRRRAGLITTAVVGVFLPLMLNLGGPIMADEPPTRSPVLATASMLFVGTLAAVNLANQFGYDGSAYAANVVIGVPGRTEVRARLVGFSIYMVPLLACVAVLVALLLDRPSLLPSMLGGLAAAYGAALAVNLLVSVFGAYALPETSNPFAISSGSGAAKSLLSMVALVGSMAATAPLMAGVVLLGDAWNVVALPIGVGYGVGAVLLGCYIAGDAIDHRAPELLQAVTPR